MPPFRPLSSSGSDAGTLPLLRLSGLLLLLFPALLTAGNPVTRVLDLDGNTVFTTREILSWLSTRVASPFSEAALQADLARIQDAYAAEGYYDARVDSVGRGLNEDSTAMFVRLRLFEGRQTVVGTMTVMGAHALATDEILGLCETRTGSPLKPGILERDIDAVLRLYEQAGYPFTRCTVESLDRVPGNDEDRLSIVLALDEGRRMTIDEIRVEGNTETRTDVVARETRFGPGEQYDPVKVEAIRPRLQRLNLFDDVSEPELYMRDSKGGLLIRVREGSTNTFDGIVGYVPAPQPGAAGYVTGLASVSMRNLFGTGRKFSFRWQREDQFSQELGVRYTEPWLFGQPFNLGGGFLQRKQDSTFVKRIFDLKGDVMLTDALTVGLLFSSESVIPADSAGTRVLRSSVLSLGVDVAYDTRNDPYSPTGGARYHSDYQYGSRRIERIPAIFTSTIRSRSSLQRFSVDCDLFFATLPRQVLALSLHGREVRSGSLDEGEMLRFGGARSLRGYREGEFLGARIAWANCEYRFLLSRRSFLAGFLDTGYYFRPADEARGTAAADDFKYGYGLGIQVETGLGIIGVSFALGEGDSFSSTKVHFGLINEF
jgi:outer membrane protein insertion porin family